MLINYCDLCGVPMKENNYFLLYIHTPGTSTPESNKYDDVNDYYRAYYKNLMQIQKEVKEICPSCKKLFDKIFEYRLERMSKLTEDCGELFNLSTIKINKKGKNHGKE